METAEGWSYLTGEHVNLHVCLKNNLSICLKWLWDTHALWPSICTPRSLSQGCCARHGFWISSAHLPRPRCPMMVLSSSSQSYRLTYSFGDNTAQSGKSSSPVRREMPLWCGKVLKAHHQPEEGTSSLKPEHKGQWSWKARVEGKMKPSWIREEKGANSMDMSLSR